MKMKIGYKILSLHIHFLLVVTMGFIFLMASCSDHENDSDSPEQNLNERVRTVAVVAPIGDAATKTRLERTAQWFTDNFRDAQKGDTMMVSLKIEWHDELSENIETLSRTLARRNDIVTVIGPFDNERMALFAAACQETHKPIIAPTVTSEDILRRFAVSTAGSQDQVNKEFFFWPLCESDVSLCETILRHYVSQKGSDKDMGVLNTAFFSPSDKYGKTFFDWAPFHTRNMDIQLSGNEQYATTDDLLNRITNYFRLTENDKEDERVASSNFCIVETSQQLASVARHRRWWFLREKAGSAGASIADDPSYDYVQPLVESQMRTWFVFPSLSEEGLASLSERDLALLQGYQGFMPYADVNTGFEKAYEERFGVKPTFAECKFYDGLLLTGIATHLYEHTFVHMEIPSDYAFVTQNYLINTCIMLLGEEREDENYETALLAWQGEGLRQYLSLASQFLWHTLRGASGLIVFDRETCMQIARTTYVNWQIDNGNIRNLFYYGPDGNRMVNPSVSWEMFANEDDALRAFEDMASDNNPDINYPALSDQYAVLVQGSNGWNNYRHQADVLSVYQLLRHHGFDDDHIILIIDGALANDPTNDDPGVIRNVALGQDLLSGTIRDFLPFEEAPLPAAVVDYDNDSLTATDISDILLGRLSSHLPVVVPQDEGLNILLYWSGHGSNTTHGGVNELRWRDSPGQGMTDALLQQTITQMTKRKLLAIVEPCYSEGVLRPLEGITGVLAMAGASGDEQSWAENWNTVLGPYGTWMYDRFTRNVVNFLTDNPTGTFRDFYLYCQKNTIGSHVKLVNAAHFGNLYRTSPEEFVVNKK